MVEAMDDSIIFAHSLEGLQQAELLADRFQATYGWETSWPKSLLYAANTPDLPQMVTMPTVDPAHPDSNTISHQPVAVATEWFDFLRVHINNPDAQYDKIRHLIADFTFPHLPTRLPLTALRRILSQCLVSRIRPYLAYQPIARDKAEDLDRLMATRVHEI